MDHVSTAAHNANMPGRVVALDEDSVTRLRIAHRRPMRQRAGQLTRMAPPGRQLDSKPPLQLQHEADAIISIRPARPVPERLAEQIEP